MRSPPDSVETVKQRATPKTGGEDDILQSNLDSMERMVLVYKLQKTAVVQLTAS